MGDADIIPIGTRGKPGRGTGAAKPSAAARGLAGDRGRANTSQKASKVPEDGTPEAPVDSEAPGDVSPTEARSDAPPPLVDAARPPATTRTRGPLAGIPVGDWLSAFQFAARELFGDDWEPQLAKFLAFLI